MSGYKFDLKKKKNLQSNGFKMLNLQRAESMKGSWHHRAPSKWSDWERDTVREEMGVRSKDKSHSWPVDNSHERNMEQCADYTWRTALGWQVAQRITHLLIKPEDWCLDP